MKKPYYRNLHFVFGVIVIMSFNLLSGQVTSVWFEENATWHYGYGEGMDTPTAGYEKLEVTGDTIINSIEYRIINRIRVYSNETIQQLDSLYLRHDPVYDKVYRHLDSTEYLLYDFSAVKGDTIIVKAISGRGDISFCHLLVDSIGIEVFSDSITRRVQYCSESLNYQFDFAGKIIEGIGSEVFLFPVDELVCDAGCANHFRCYQDSKIIITNPNIGCEELVTSSYQDFAPSDKIRVYPNPAHDYIVIKSDDVSDIGLVEIYDIAGKVVLSYQAAQLAGEYRIGIEELSEGYYMVRFRQKDNYQVQRFIKR